MAQLDFLVACTPNRITPGCGQDFHLEADGIDTGGIQYAASRVFSPCHSPVTDTKAPPNLASGATWESSRWDQINHRCFDAAHPPIVSPGSFPLPPHCWGWTGSDDYDTQTYYPLAGTVAQIVDTANEFAVINRCTVTVDYDVRLQRRYTQRKLVWLRADFLHGFDFSGAADSDTCTDLSSSDTTVHHSQVVYTSVPPLGVGIPVGTNNALDLGIADTHSASAQAGGFLTTYAFGTSEYQDSTYVDPALSNGCFGTSQRNHWGTFSQGYGPLGKNQLSGASLEWDVIYQFGRETQTVSNVRFTIDLGWVQYHCVPDGATIHPCNCNEDCPPCQGANSLKSGSCATFCANSGLSDTLVQGWVIRDQNGNIVSATGDAHDWFVEQKSQCSVRVCAPCLSAARVRAGDFGGPYTITWGTSETCECDGRTHYKVLTATFTLTADVICPEIIPPQLGIWVSYDVSDDRRHARAFCTLTTDLHESFVYVAIANNVFPLVWPDHRVEVIAGRCCIRWDRQSLAGRLYLFVQSGGGVRLYRSQDAGRTFTFLANVGTGQFPALVIARDGRRLCYWVAVDGTKFNLVGKWYDGAGAVIKDEFAAIKDIDNACIAIDESVGEDLKWRLTALYIKDGNILAKTSLDGVVFTA